MTKPKDPYDHRHVTYTAARTVAEEHAAWHRAGAPCILCGAVARGQRCRAGGLGCSDAQPNVLDYRDGIIGASK